MSKSCLTYTFLLLLFVPGFFPEGLKAQSPFDPVYSGEAEKIRERVQVFTDRNLYAVNELLHFVADYSLEGGPEGMIWSSVLYVELISGEGKAVEQGKFPIIGNQSRGSLQIPLSALSGDYYLKCYTRWMRNSGPATFAIVPLKIVNPFRNEVLTHAGSAPSAESFTKLAYEEGALLCSTSSESFVAGEEVKIHLDGPLPDYLDLLNCCLTVVPEGLVDLDEGQYLPPAADSVNEAFEVSLLPDLGSGVAISGRVVDEQQNPVDYVTLHFSLLGETPDYFATISDNYGRFIFTAPAGEGPQELFMTPRRLNGSPLEVRIDQEYDNQDLSLPDHRFQLSQNQEELARRISLNMQLSRAFAEGAWAEGKLRTEAPDKPGRARDIPFYGTRVQRLVIDDYIRLPNLEEVFINLVPDVQFYRKRGENRIRILSENVSIGIYEPLIMIDNISIFDHEAVLALTPGKIERIDLINEVYLKGNVAFGGVLAIYSKKGDMAGIDLPAASYFFDYHFFYPSRRTKKPKMLPSDSQTSGRIPDSRNTFCWRDDLQLRKGNPLEISFTAPHAPGDYVVLVRGTGPLGKVLKATARFRVK